MPAVYHYARHVVADSKQAFQVCHSFPQQAHLPALGVHALRKVPGWRLRLRVPRPRFCALSNRKLAAAGIEMPHWRDAVARYARLRG